MRRWQAMQTLDSRLCSSFSQVFLTMQWWPLMCIAAHSTILGGTQETFSINLRNERFDLRLFPWGICFLLVDGQGKEKYLNKRNELSLSPPFPRLLWMDLINCPQGNAQLWIPFGAVKSCSTQSLPFPMTWAAYLYLCDVNTYCISGKTTIKSQETVSFHSDERSGPGTWDRRGCQNSICLLQQGFSALD